MGRFIICMVMLSIACSSAFAVDFFAHQAGIWSIDPTEKLERWVIVHDIENSVNSGIYHIEVIGRAHNAPAWQVERLVRHMAITEKALKASVKKPLTKGAVYPESFDSAYAAWRQENKGKGGMVFDTTVLDCIQETAKLMD